MRLSDIKGIGAARLISLQSSGIRSIRDLLYYLPVRYEDHRFATPSCCKSDGSFLFEGVIASAPKITYFGGKSKTTVELIDEYGSLNVCWFNQPWMSKNIKKGTRVRLYGRMHEHNSIWSLLNPAFVTDYELMPVYRRIKGFPAKTFREVISIAVAYLDEVCPEFIPNEILEEYTLLHRNEALFNIHFPKNIEQISAALNRITFEKILVYQSAVALHSEKRETSYKFILDSGENEKYWQSLPFCPTDSQKKVLDDIFNDLIKPTAMHRLLQGDVGSGKTAVAFGAIYLTKQAGLQAAMMAPTEILARQHYESALKILAPLNIQCRLLTGSTGTKERRKVLDDLKSGKCNAVFGTHSLISKDVEYFRLGLVITDEQHRFGVRQRTLLERKGCNSGNNYPHVLVMSATPIPRTLALIIYGDLDLSALTDMPPGRQPVKTCIVPSKKRNDMYRFLVSEIKRGRQAYIVCPLVHSDDEENEKSSAKEMYNSLKNGPLAGFSLGLTWGSQKPDEKISTLKSFSEGSIDILVATTVIEVGINVPNATIMIVENANRFGLSQLHQLRGRVGRGKEESWCFLLSDSNERLRVLTRTNDGFAIAKKDLEIRGPGDLLGTRQSGEIMNMLLANTVPEIKLLDSAVSCVNKLRADPAKRQILAGLCAASDEYSATGYESIACN